MAARAIRGLRIETAARGDHPATVLEGTLDAGKTRMIVGRGTLGAAVLAALDVPLLGSCAICGGKVKGQERFSAPYGGPCGTREDAVERLERWTRSYCRSDDFYRLEVYAVPGMAYGWIHEGAVSWAVNCKYKPSKSRTSEAEVKPSEPGGGR
jgi:hypothetical protein